MDLDAGQTGPGCQNLAFQRFEPIIIHDFSWRFRKKALEKHISKQMRVYKQITFFIKNQDVKKYFSWIDTWIFEGRIDVRIEKLGAGTGTNRNQTERGSRPSNDSVM